LIGALGACHLVPQAVRGVPFEEPWLVLPLRSWLAENRAEPEAIALCRPPVCGPGLVVGVVRLSGREADLAEGALRSPERLARALSTPKDPKSTVQTAATAKPLVAGASRGLTLTLQRRDGTHPAYGAVLAHRFGADLRMVLVIGEDPDSVENTARRVAREHMGSGDIVSPASSL